MGSSSPIDGFGVHSRSVGGGVTGRRAHGGSAYLPDADESAIEEHQVPVRQRQEVPQVPRQAKAPSREGCPGISGEGTKRQAYQQKHGHARPPMSAMMGDKRMIVIGGAIYKQTQEGPYGFMNVVHDCELKVFGIPYLEEQEQRPLQERYPALQCKSPWRNGSRPIKRKLSSSKKGAVWPRPPPWNALPKQPATIYLLASPGRERDGQTAPPLPVCFTLDDLFGVTRMHHDSNGSSHGNSRYGRSHGGAINGDQ